jgi:hypothetical protein
VIIDYDTLTDAFLKIADIVAPDGAAGTPAVGDFDEDGRMEFIWGNGYGGSERGYQLFEWQDPFLVYIGMVGDTIDAMSRSAVACRPKPGGVLHALVGYSGLDLPWTYAYHLLAPTGDNSFEVVYRFEDYTGYTGSHPCAAADVDCDGVDELVMGFHPENRVWQWDDTLADFSQQCAWHKDTYGAMEQFYAVDLDRNGALEWGAVATADYRRAFFAFPGLECVYCDELGHCPVESQCFCVCKIDPVCDGETGVLDVVAAVDVAFRNSPAVPDPFPICPHARTDADCNGHTDVLDVIRFVNVAFRNADPALEFCDPCS